MSIPSVDPRLGRGIHLTAREARKTLMVNLQLTPGWAGESMSTSRCSTRRTSSFS